MTSHEKDFDNNIREQYGFDFELKDEQIEILHKIVNKKHCLGILPTGYGKSMCFIYPPLILSEENKGHWL